MKNSKIFLIVLLLLIVSCIQKNTSVIDESTVIKQLPDTSYFDTTVAHFDSSDYVVQLKHMQKFYDVPGEFGYIAEGKNYGFKALSFIMTNTQPNGGPPLHTHETEEAHVLHEGSILYTMDNKVFAAKAPFIVRIPAGMPHTFINTWYKPVHITAVFPSNLISYTNLGRNPLVKDTSVYHKKQ